MMSEYFICDVVMQGRKHRIVGIGGEGGSRRGTTGRGRWVLLGLDSLCWSSRKWMKNWESRWTKIVKVVLCFLLEFFGGWSFCNWIGL